MKWILTFTVTCFALVNQALAQTDDMVIKFADTNPRVWADSSNQNQITARLLSRNTQDNKVSLECGDGMIIEVLLSDLPISDRKYIARKTSQAKRAAHRLKSQRPSGDTDLGVDASQNAQPSRKPDGKVGKPRRVNKIDWHRSPQTARTAATADDRPIIWFRVLGDLEGYM